MPDTGAPWNIPYVAGTDLVADWPTDSQALATAIADGLDVANIALGPNTVQTFKNDAFSTTSTSFVDITGMSVTITPSSASSLVLVLFAGNFGGTTTGDAKLFNLRRDSTTIAQPASGTIPSTFESIVPNIGAGNFVGIVFLDSPATTSAVTYSIQARTTGGTLFLNRANNANVSSVSTITAIEVSA